MAPRKNSTAATPFYDDDVLFITQDTEEEVLENQETDVLIDEDAIRSRRYKFMKGKWVYMGVFDGEDLVEAPPSAKEEEPKKEKKPRAAPKKEKEPIVAKSSDDEEPIVAKSSDDEEPTSEEEPKEEAKKDKKARTSVSLTSVMEALEANKADQAKKLLVKFIEKNGAEGKQRKKRDPNAPVVEKKRSAYQQFLSDEMKRIAQEEANKPDGEKMPQTERMIAALAAWREHKAKQAAN